VDVLKLLIDGGADLNKALPVTTCFSVYFRFMSNDAKFSPDSFRSRKSGTTPLALAQLMKLLPPSPPPPRSFFIFRFIIFIFQS